LFDDIDRAYVVAQMEGAMEAPVDVSVSVHRVSRLLLPGGALDSGADLAHQAEQLGRELADLEPRIRVTVTDSTDALPVFSVAGRDGGGVVRFVGQPRVNLFRALLEAIRRASTGDHGVSDDDARRLRALPRAVGARVFATPT